MTSAFHLFFFSLTFCFDDFVFRFDNAYNRPRNSSQFNGGSNGHDKQQQQQRSASGYDR